MTSTYSQKDINMTNIIEQEFNFPIHLAEPEMIFVQGGTFTMGATFEQDRDPLPRESPAHSVTVSDFYIGKHEITQAQWRAVMNNNPSFFKGDNLPVENVSWDDVQEFICKLNAMTGKQYRLPTEAEWEFAARGGNSSKGYKYSGSNILNDVAWNYENAGDNLLDNKTYQVKNVRPNNNKTHPVGKKSPNELGIYDMSGNVFEWCQDYCRQYSNEPAINPVGTYSLSFCVMCGGSWHDRTQSCRVSFRGQSKSNFRNHDYGFRLALVPSKN